MCVCEKKDKIELKDREKKDGEKEKERAIGKVTEDERKRDKQVTTYPLNTHNIKQANKQTRALSRT